MIKRTISTMVGAGSKEHNERRFTAENVDPNRTQYNTVFINENIKQVYHEMFDDALERYNQKQTRKDRKIENYYDHIRRGKQEKPFHELIVQVGNRDDMGCDTKEQELAEQILTNYMYGFHKRNPNLRVFAAFLHMDEATPHLHIDFIPYTMESKRGLDTRVSLKQALNQQGFKGTSKSETEWKLWTDSEKQALANSMQRFGVLWEKKDIHREHLSVLNYKKEQREEEIEVLDRQISGLLQDYHNAENEMGETVDELSVLQTEKESAETEAKKSRIKADKEYQRLAKITPYVQQVESYGQKYMGDLNEILPEPGTLEMAKNYRDKKVKPIIKELVNTVRSLYRSMIEWKEKYQSLVPRYNRKFDEVDRLKDRVHQLVEEKDYYLSEIKDYDYLKSALGIDNTKEMIEAAKLEEQEEKERKRMQRRKRSKDYER